MADLMQDTPSPLFPDSTESIVPDIVADDSTDCDGYRLGVVPMDVLPESVDDVKPVEKLTNMVAIPSSMLQMPCYVLHESSSEKVDLIKLRLKTKEFTFERSREGKMPTAAHYHYLLLLIAKFANQFNEEGKLYFKYSEILKLAGVTKKSKGSVDAIKEAILRYSTSTAHCQFPVRLKDGTVKEERWDQAFIKRSSIYNTDNKTPNKHNPRNSKNQRKYWHEIQFCDAIVDALREDRTRLYFEKFFRVKMSKHERTIFNYFWAFGDKKAYFHPFFEGGNSSVMTPLISAFNYKDRKSRFVIWIKKHLTALFERGVFEQMEIVDDKAVKIKIKAFKNSDITEDGRIIDASAKVLKTEKAKVVSIECLSDVELVDIYKRHVELISEEKVKGIDSLLELKLQSAISLIKSSMLEVFPSGKIEMPGDMVN